MRRHIQIGIVLAACLLLVLTVAPISAQLAPKITVAPNWSAAQLLNSLDTNGAPYPQWDEGDDYRYVWAWMNVTTTVEFWAVEMNCTANGNVLDTYVQDAEPWATPNDYEDDQPPVSWIGSTWDGPDGWTSWTSQYQNTGGVLKISAVASKRGRNLPVGRNGVQTMVTVAGLHFRVKPGATGTSPLTCTMSFLDRNGKVVVAPTYTAPTPVTIIGGYTVTGTVSYQARTVKNNIGVNCWIDGNPVSASPFLTNAAGAFTIPNIRTWNHINCHVYGNIRNPSPGEESGDLYLASQFNFNVGEHGTYRELPIELSAGNLNPNDCDPSWPGDWQCINDDDLAVLTGAWGTANGDVNGDLKTDKSDLAIVAGNMGRGEDVDASHVLYSLARSWATTGRNSRIYRGDRQSGAVVEQIPGVANTADFWATLSKDGQKIAFIRKTSVTGQPAKYELFTAPAAGGTPTVLITKAAMGNMDAFAPSWSEDGMAIVFVCSKTSGTPGVPDSGYLYNAGNLCVIDSNGRNFHQVTGSIYSPENAVRIYPPALTFGKIIFAGTSNAVGCANTLCMNEWNNTYLALDSDDIPAPPVGVADMPVSVNGWLFYRYTSGGNAELRYITQLDGDCHAGPGEPCNWDYVKSYDTYVGRDCPAKDNPRKPFAHSTVVFDKDLSSACNYEALDWNEALGAPYSVGSYELSPYGFEIMLNNDSGTSFRNSGYQWGLNLEDTNPDNPDNCANGITGPTDADQCWPEWSPLAYFPPPTPPENSWWVDEHMIGSQVSDDWWDGDPTVPTLRHAERATMDWTP